MHIPELMSCAEVVQAWGLARDQGRWDDLLATFHPGGRIHVSWFEGPFPDFVERCRENFDRGAKSKHLLWPARISMNGSRALAETSVAILVRQTIEGIETDLTSYGRFLDRMERRSGVWRICERACVYERDRLDPVEPSSDFAALMSRSGADRYPSPYRYMAFRVAAAGRTLAEPVHHDGRAETEVLKTRFAAWLGGA